MDTNRNLGNEPKKGASSKSRFPAKTVAVFIALGAAGITVTSIAGKLVDGYNQTVLSEIGSAVFGGALAFFLVQIFAWTGRRDSSERF